MGTTRTYFLILVSGLTVALSFGQVAQPAHTPASPARVLAGVRDFTPDALQGMAVLADHREWLEMAAKAIQAGGKPDLANSDMPAAVRNALETFSDVPELILLLAARPDELATLREIQREAPEGVTLRAKQLRSDYSYAHREGAIAWQRLLQSDPVALGQYREYLTQYCEQQQKRTPGFAVVRVTDREYYSACPPDDAIMTYAHEAGPPAALGRLIAKWWDDYGTEAVDDAVAERSLDPRPSSMQDSVIDMPRNRRASMWKPVDEKAMETVGLVPVVLQPFEDQPDGAKVAMAVQEMARVWSLGEGSPEGGPVVGAQDAPRAQAPEQPAEALPEVAVDDLAARAEANGPYTVLEPRYAWPGVTTYGLSSYGGFCYVPYSGYVSNYTYVNGYPYWYCPPPNCGRTYMYFPQCRPTYSYLRDPYERRGGFSFGLHSGGSYIGLNTGDRDCRRYGVYQYGGRYGRDWDREHHGRDWDRERSGRYSDDAGVVIQRPANRDSDPGRGGRSGTVNNGNQPRNDGRRSGISDIGHRPWNTNSWGRSNGGNRGSTQNRLNGQSGGQGARDNGTAVPAPRANPAPRVSPAPRANPAPASPSVAPRPSVRPATGERSPRFAPRGNASSEQRSNRVSPQPTRQSGSRSSVFDRVQSARQNWNSRPGSPARDAGERNQGSSRSNNGPGILNKIKQNRQNNQPSRTPR